MHLNEFFAMMHTIRWWQRGINSLKFQLCVIIGVFSACVVPNLQREGAQTCASTAVVPTQLTCPSSNISATRITSPEIPDMTLTTYILQLTSARFNYCFPPCSMVCRSSFVVCKSCGGPKIVGLHRRILVLSAKICHLHLCFELC